MRIPFLDLSAAYRELKNEIDDSVARVLRSGSYILGSDVSAFEEKFAEYTGTSYAVGVANGLDALQLALEALDIKQDDEVIVPSHTFIATWLAVSRCGAVPVPVDPAPGTLTIDPSKIESVISNKTRAIVAVHLYGLPADLRPIHEIAAKYRLKIVEDAAQAHGARYRGERIGGHSDLVAWSFYPGKNLGAFGDGGAVTTNNSHLVEKLRILRNYGSRTKYVHESRGINSRLDSLQAAILSVKLAHLDDWNARRSGIANLYLKTINNPRVSLPVAPDWADPVWHLFVIRHPDRDALQQSLLAHGVQTLIHYPIPPHKQGAYSEDFHGASYPLAEELSKSVLSLPIGPHLSVEQAREVAELVNDLA